MGIEDVSQFGYYTPINSFDLRSHVRSYLVPDECQHTIFHTYLTHTVQEQGVNQIIEE
jgi:hypothetical protein